MRSQTDIDSIKNRISDPYSINDFISVEDINHLVDLFESQKTEPNVVYKNTGPITLDINDYLTDSVLSKIIGKLHREIGPYEITAGFFFTTNYPHVIHNDDTFELPNNVYKGITIPLKLYGEGTGYPKLCMFDQFYFHGPAKFFKGESHVDTYYNKCIYDYSDVDGLVEFHIVDCELFTHLKSNWLEGLSLHAMLDWKPGSVMIFDSVRLHCASDFRQLGYHSKLGISIFTKQGTT
jgi:hypothetical protein